MVVGREEKPGGRQLVIGSEEGLAAPYYQLPTAARQLRLVQRRDVGGKPVRRRQAGVEVGGHGRALRGHELRPRPTGAGLLEHGRRRGTRRDRERLARLHDEVDVELRRERLVERPGYGGL